jgi:hypothetical protein
MGVPAPTAAATAAVAAGTAMPAPTTWLYCYTYVTKLGTALVEESAPSPSVTIITASGVNQAVALSGIADPPTLTGYNYIGKRIYRTTGTTFQLVNATLVSGVYVSIPIGTTTYTDNTAPTAIPGDALPSLGWLPPPADLKGLVSMPSGTMAGFRNNEIWFSEPGFPHAWPVRYMQALDAQIVAIKAFGNNLAVATKANPFVGSGVYPDSFTFTKIPRLEPCISKRSMAGDEHGAVYASNNGLISLGLDGDNIATSEILTRLEFDAYTPSSITGIVFENRYYGFYTTSGIPGTLVYSAIEQAGMRTLSVSASAAIIEPESAKMLYVDAVANTLQTFDPVNTVPLTYTWKSKLFVMPFPTNFGYIKVSGKESTDAQIAYDASVAAANAVINASNAAAFLAGNLYSAMNEHAAMNEYELNGSTLTPLIPSVVSTVSLIVWAGSVQQFGGTIELNKVYTLPGGFKSLGWEIQVSGQREVLGIEMANSIKELKAS